MAHGGACVARFGEEGRVVFVRHALPGELVVAEVTEGTEGDRFWRADTVEVVQRSPDRVDPPCPASGAGGCGGCDFQHVALTRQRELKAAVVAEQLRRLAGIERAVEVEAVPGDEDGLRYRTRVRYARTPEGGRGFRAHRSRRVVPVDECLIAGSDARVAGAAGPAVVTERVETAYGTHTFDVAADGFWQVHPGAPRVLVESVLAGLAARPGESALDLYAGVGLFSAFVADAVGASGRVTAVEGEHRAVGHARTNLTGHPWAEVLSGDVGTTVAGLPAGTTDLVVLDPPREGARALVVRAVAARRPRAIAYVACDPAALARDIATFAEEGYRLDTLRAFDLFPMTSHVEAVALLERAGF